MLLIHTQKHSPRIDYAFKHICTRILGIEVKFASIIEEFISYDGPKLSYGKQSMGNELFIQAHGLLNETGFEDLDITVLPWGDTYCFFSVSDKSELPFDIFSAAFYMLSRYEEYVPHVKDELRRFPASESLAHKEGFLKQPVVDIWAYQFKIVLQRFYPNMIWPIKKTAVHHLVETSRPFRYSQLGFLRTLMGFFSDAAKLRLASIFKRTRVLLGLRKDPFNTFTWIVNAAKNQVNKTTVFFLLGEGFTFSEDFNTKRKRYISILKFVGDYHEVGLLFSYHSLDVLDILKFEKHQLEELTHRPLKSTMNDQNLVNLPHNYRNLLELEVKRDFTLYFADSLGFRAGTATPFLFYDLDYEVKTPLVIHPVVGTTKSLIHLRAGEIDNEVKSLLKNVQAVDGTFSLVFSNQDFTTDKRNKIWKQLFSEL